MTSVLGFLAILAPLVIVHEFGHFLFAKLFKVKAEIFSVGFGPKLWARQWGETEFRISALPLGGYVKLFGEDPTAEVPKEQKKRSLHGQKAWKRFFIFFGGPLFNFIFAAFVFMLIMALGEPQVTSTVGRVVPHSDAARAGLQSGDRVTAINGKSIQWFQDLVGFMTEHPDEKHTFRVSRMGGGTQDIDIQLTSEEGFSIYGEKKRVGILDGILPLPRESYAGVSHPGSEAAKASIRTGDRVVEFNSSPIASWEQLEGAYQNWKAGTPVTLKIRRSSGEEAVVQLRKPSHARDMSVDWGLHSSELFVKEVVAQSPAQKVGILAGDRLIEVNGQVVYSFFDLKDAVQRSGEAIGQVQVKVERNGQFQDFGIVPSHAEERNAVLEKKSLYTIGVMPELRLGEPVTEVVRVLNPFTLFVKGWERMFRFSWQNLISIGKLFTGQVSLTTLGGPIQIGRIAGMSLERGLISFLTTMAMLSVGLAILNTLPIPVLDGGHILLLGIEVLRRKPLSVRQIEIAQQVGLSFILLLMVIVFRNDIIRLPIFN